MAKKKVYPKAKKPVKATVTKDSGPDEIPEDSEVAKLIAKLTFRQKAWADFFIKTLNKRKASLAVGCSSENANAYGSYMYGIQVVREYIEHIVTSAIGSIDDNVKFVQSIRDARMGDYLKKVKVTKSDLVKVPLQAVIDRTKFQLVKEEEYFMLAEEPKEITAAMQSVRALRKSIARMEIDLKFDPKATRIEHGETYLADDVELDLVKLAADTEHGLIKTFKHTKDGVQVELYSSLDAANTLARIQGADKGSAPTTNVYAGPTTEQLAKLSKEELKVMIEIEKKMKS